MSISAITPEAGPDFAAYSISLVDLDDAVRGAHELVALLVNIRHNAREGRPVAADIEQARVIAIELMNDLEMAA